MVEITRQEANHLENLGYRWHEEIFSTTTRHHFYAAEFPWVMADLREFRKEVTS